MNALTKPGQVNVHQAKTNFSLAVTVEHALHAGAMAGAHRDSFDRLIAAQGIIENAVVITRDKDVAAFGCPTLW